MERIILASPGEERIHHIRKKERGGKIEGIRVPSDGRGVGGMRLQEKRQRSFG